LVEEIGKGKRVCLDGAVLVSLTLPLEVDEPSPPFWSLDWDAAGGTDGWLAEGELDFRSWYRRTLLTVGHFSCG